MFHVVNSIAADNIKICLFSRCRAVNSKHGGINGGNSSNFTAYGLASGSSSKVKLIGGHRP